MAALQNWIGYLALGLFVWIAVLSFYLIKTAGQFRKLTKGTKNQNLTQIIEKMIASDQNQSRQIAQFSEHLSKIEKNQQNFLQKFSLLRFNPFEETGGDQSFVVTFLDGKNNGVVISSLHSRGGTRVYAKPVTGGKPANYQFSKEEKEVVEKAGANGRETARQLT